MGQYKRTTMTNQPTFFLIKKYNDATVLPNKNIRGEVWEAEQIHLDTELDLNNETSKKVFSYLESAFDEEYYNMTSMSCDVVNNLVLFLHEKYGHVYGIVDYSAIHNSHFQIFDCEYSSITEITKTKSELPIEIGDIFTEIVENM